MATLGRDGGPQTSVVWIELDGDRAVDLRGTAELVEDLEKELPRLIVRVTPRKVTGFAR